MRQLQRWNRRRSSPWKGAAAGLIGGLAASWTMNLFQAAWSRVQRENSKTDRHKSRRQPQDEDATVKTARAISEGVFGHELTAKQKKLAGPLVHYAFGTVIGGLYGAAAEREPRASAGAGLPLGTAFWLIADEIAVPALRLSKPPQNYPVSTHLYALASHWVYGATTELVRRILRRVL